MEEPSKDIILIIKTIPHDFPCALYRYRAPSDGPPSWGRTASQEAAVQW